jgi:hypothetical protein
MSDPESSLAGSSPSTAPAPDYSADGVDLSLIRWTLSLTPAERLRFLEERINEILVIRELNATLAGGAEKPPLTDVRGSLKTGWLALVACDFQIG